MLTVKIVAFILLVLGTVLSFVIMGIIVIKVAPEWFTLYCVSIGCLLFGQILAEVGK